MTRELGIALGVGLLGTVFAAGYGLAIEQRLAAYAAGVSASAGRGIANAQAIASEAQPYAAAAYRHTQEAFIQGWQQALWAGVAVMAVLLAFVLTKGPERQPCAN